MTTDVEQLARAIQTDRKVTVAVLITLHTGDNGVRFDHNDATICTGLARLCLEGVRLKPQQLRLLQHKLAVYAARLAGAGFNGGKQAERTRAPRERLERAPRQRDRRPTPAKATHKKERVAYLHDGAIVVRFPFDREMNATIKKISGWQYLSRFKRWQVPLTVEAVQVLGQHHFALGKSIITWRDGLGALVQEVPGLVRPLYEFQRAGVSFIEAHGGRALLADEMGLGKTVQTIAWLLLHPEVKRAVVIAPASLKLSWLREFSQCAPGEQPVVISGRPKTKGEAPVGWTADTRVLIINYDIVATIKEVTATKATATKKARKAKRGQFGWDEWLKAWRPELLVLDESHFIKNRKAERSSKCIALGRRARHIICLSGTPIINRPNELFNSIHLVAPKLFPSFWPFAHRYCGAVHNGFGWDFSGATNTAELHTKLTGTVMLRRLKSEVLKELPPIVRTVVPLELENIDQYKRAEAALMEQAAQEAKRGAKGVAAALRLISELMQLATKLKMKQAIAWVRDWVDNGNKLVAFCTHREPVNKMMAAFKGIAVRIDGRDSGEARQAAVDGFQDNDMVRVLVGNMQAAGVGLNLTAAPATCFIELGWTPGEHDQAEARVHRIGQESASVSAYYLVASGTIEERICALLDKKRGVTDQVLDGRATTPGAMLVELLATYKEDK